MDDRHHLTSDMNMPVDWGFMTVPNVPKPSRYFGNSHTSNKLRPPPSSRSLAASSSHGLPTLDKGQSTASPSRCTQSPRCDFIYLRDVSFCRFVRGSVAEPANKTKNAKDYLRPLIEKRKASLSPCEKPTKGSSSLRSKEAKSKSRHLAFLRQNWYSTQKDNHPCLPALSSFKHKHT